MTRFNLEGSNEQPKETEEKKTGYSSIDGEWLREHEVDELPPLVLSNDDDDFLNATDPLEIFDDNDDFLNMTEPPLTLDQDLAFEELDILSLSTIDDKDIEVLKQEIEKFIDSIEEHIYKKRDSKRKEEVEKIKEQYKNAATTNNRELLVSIHKGLSTLAITIRNEELASGLENSF